MTWFSEKLFFFNIYFKLRGGDGGSFSFSQSPSIYTNLRVQGVLGSLLLSESKDKYMKCKFKVCQDSLAGLRKSNHVAKLNYDVIFREMVVVF